MNIFVLFYRNGEHKILKEKLGMGFPLAQLKNEDIEYLYVAVSDQDAQNMINLRVEDSAKAKKSKDGIIKELADRLISTLDDSVPAAEADATVADVAKAMYNEVLEISGNIVIDRNKPVGILHAGGHASRIAKYKFQRTEDDDDKRPN